MHRKSLTGEAKLNRDKAMLNDYKNKPGKPTTLVVG